MGRHSRATERGKQLSNNDPYIPNIYRYCDGWCERCRLTQRCRRFSLAPLLKDEEGNLDQNAFFETLNETLSDSLSLLREMAEEEGIEPLSDAEYAERMAEQEALDDSVDNHELILAANLYATLVEGWFVDSEELFLAKGKELTRLLTANAPGLNPAEEARLLVAAGEVIRWDQYLVAMKLMEALLSQSTNQTPDPSMQKDPENPWDGDAKVALLSMDRSLDAWGLILRAFADREDESLTILAHLTRLQRMVEAAFPQARSFHRPGFDD